MSSTVAKQPADIRLSRAELRGRWQQMLRNPLLNDIPGKLELNDWGTIELTPPNTRHAVLQAFVAYELRRCRPDGTTLGECGIETDIGVRVPDVAWASAEYMYRHGSESPLPRAPDLCVEVLTPTNSRIEMREKTSAYLAAGATEVWLVAEDGTVEMFDETGRIAVSALGIALGPAPALP